MSIINGRKISNPLEEKDISYLCSKVKSTMSLSLFDPGTIINMLDNFVKGLTSDEFSKLYHVLLKMGFSKNFSKNILCSLINCFSKKYTLTQIKADFGTDNPFKTKTVNDIAKEKFVPLGVITHITASNSPDNPVLSLRDGLITGNINIIKLPSKGNLFADEFITILLKKIPELTSYIHLLNISSHESSLIKQIVNLADGVVVWGSDKATSGISKMLNPNQRMIFWGNKISFAYVSNSSKTNKSKLASICHDVCITNQLACNSPQCILVESKNNDEVIKFANLLSECMNKVSPMYPTAKPDIHEQSEITTQLMMAKADELFGEKYVIEDKNNNDWSIIVNFQSKITASPLFRTILVFPVETKNLYECLFPIRRYLQTASLTCSDEERSALQDILIHAGVTRVCYPGDVHSGYVGEPHDGERSLTRLVKCIRLLNP